jgi:hypothetical protein
MLMQKILLALNDETDGKPGTAPPGAKLVAYVGPLRIWQPGRSPC